MHCWVVLSGISVISFWRQPTSGAVPLRGLRTQLRLRYAGGWNVGGVIPEISEQGLDSRKETVLQSEPMKQTTEKSSVVITKKTEMGKSKTETEPTESSRLMRGAGNDSPNTSRSSAPKRLLRSRLQRRMQPLSGRGIALNLYQKHIRSRTS